MSLCTTPTHPVSRFECRCQSSSSTKYVNRRVICVSNPVSHSKSTTSTRRSNWKRCEYIDLHNELVPYQKAWDLQKSVVREKKVLIERNEECCDTLIVLQHRPVYTLGTGGSEEFLNFNIRDSTFDVFRTERGGQVTYHGPGQIVMYPIINLRNHQKDLHWYLRNLEEVVIRVLSTFSIEASRVEGLTGVWVGDKKLAAIGIKVSQWIAYHGLALNVSMDLSPFHRIVPCGIRDRGVGSIKNVLQETRAEVENLWSADGSTLINIVYESLMREFAEVFQVELEPRSMPTMGFE